MGVAQGRVGDMAEVRALSVVVAGNAALSSLRFLVGVLGALATSVLLARYLGPTDFGTYRLAMSLVWVLELASVLGFPNATTKFVAELSGSPESGRWTAAVRFFLVRATVGYLIGFALLLAFRRSVARFYHDETLASILVVAALAVLPGLWCGILSAGLQGLQRFGELSRITLGQAIASLAGTVLVVAFAGGIQGLFVLAIGVNVLGLAMATRCARRASPLAGRGAEFGPELRRRMWRYSLMLAAISLTGALLSERLEVFFLGRFWSPAEVGFYSLAVTLAFHARRLGPNALGEVLFPVIARLDGRGDAWGVANAYVHSTRYLAMAAFPLGVGGAIFAGPLLRMLFGPAYLPAAPALAVLMTATGLAALSHPAASVILSKERNAFLLVSSLLIAAANILLDLLLIPPYAAIGAAMANAVVQAVWLTVQTVIVSRWLRVRLPGGNIARSLLATLLAFVPAASIRTWPLLGGAADVLLTLGTFVVLYPVLLAVLGALLPQDMTRLRALEGAVPLWARPHAAMILSILSAFMRARPR